MKTTMWAIALALGTAQGAPAHAQTMFGGAMLTPRAPIVLVDATGKVAGRPLNDTMVLVAVDGGGADAPAFIRQVFDDASRAASGQATWQSGGSVLFTSADCTVGAHVHSLSHPGVRSTTQVETPAGTMLYVGAAGASATRVIRSILYGNGCTPVTVQQDGLIPVEATLNLTVAFPPPLSFR